nr:hypothetical protein [Tanacetum cinerariifolium]
MYSASVLEISALFCLFDDQLISLSLRNCTPPDVLHEYLGNQRDSHQQKLPSLIPRTHADWKLKVMSTGCQIKEGANHTTGCYIDHLGKFDGIVDEGYFVGYSMNSKAFKVYNIRTRRVKDNLHIVFLENRPIVAGAGPEWLYKDSIGASQSSMETRSTQDYVFMPLWKDGSPLFDSSPKLSDDAGSPSSGDAGKKHDEVLDKESGASNELNYAFKNLNTEYPNDLKMPGLETIATYDDSEEEDDFTNLESSIHVSPTPTTRTHKNHPLKQVIRSLNTPIQTMSKLKPTNKQGFISAVYEGKTYEDLNTCLFAYFLSQIEPTRVAKALSDPAWVEEMQEELLQFKLQKIDVKSTFLYRSIEDEVYVCQPLGFEDPDHPDKVYVDDIIFGSTKKELCTEFERLMKDKFQMSSMKELTFFLGLQVKQKEDEIFISQNKYVAEVLRKFNFLYVKSASTLVDMEKTLVKDANGDDVKQSSMVGFGKMIQYNLTNSLCLKQPFIREESPVYTMVDQRTMAELLRVPTEGYAQGKPVDGSKKNTHILFLLGRILYKDLLRACPHHGFTELHQLDTFYNALNPADQDSLNSAAGGNLLERRTQDVLTIIENKSEVCNSRNKSIVSQVRSSDANSSSSEIAKLTHAVNQQTSAVTTTLTAILKQFQATPPLASCLATDGNTFSELRDNIQGYIATAAVNYNQNNSGSFSGIPSSTDTSTDLQELVGLRRLVTKPGLDLFAGDGLSDVSVTSLRFFFRDLAGAGLGL